MFKDGGKEEKKKNPTSSPVKCYFVQMESDAQIDRNVKYILSNKTIYEARCVFMHAHTVSSINSYMARYVGYGDRSLRTMSMLLPLPQY